ncbi:hypothetical protein NUW58_g7273 [Xylaria curta]|uniref:Uncharacterized protein n=1 Tax=Xylaria curta TaxID=42375 RepID=A0ACC1NJX6_9PEZI|nr:hypothetical protein NUW58_g7273 [Xylaria curta]
MRCLYLQRVSAMLLLGEAIQDLSIDHTTHHFGWPALRRSLQHITINTNKQELVAMAGKKRPSPAAYYPPPGNAGPQAQESSAALLRLPHPLDRRYSRRDRRRRDLRVYRGHIHRASHIEPLGARATALY